MPKKLNDSDLLGIVKFRALTERIKGVRIDANVNFCTILLQEIDFACFKCREFESYP